MPDKDYATSLCKQRYLCEQSRKASQGRKGKEEEGRWKRHERSKESQGKIRAFVDGSHEWGRIGSGDYEEQR